MLAAELSGELTSAVAVENIEPEINLRAQYFKQTTGEAPSLLIVAPDAYHDGSQRYMRMKQKIGERLGVAVGIESPESLEQIKDTIGRANQDEGVHGVIVQLPLAPYMADSTKEILDSVNPLKDVDGLGEGSSVTPATALAVDRILWSYGVDGIEEDVALIGLGALVNAPLRCIWDQGDSRLKGFDETSDRLELLEAINNVHLIVSATGKPSILTPDLFLPNTGHKIIVDVGTAGTAKEKGKSQHGDVSDELRAHALEQGWAITKETGGVGPLTVRMLMKSVVDAAERQAGISVSERNLGMVMLATGANHQGFGEDDRSFNPVFGQAAFSN